MAIFSDRDLSFSEVCEDLSWVRARSPHNEMMRTQLYARLLPCSVRGRAARCSGRVVVCRGPYAACTIHIHHPFPRS